MSESLRKSMDEALERQKEPPVFEDVPGIKYDREQYKDELFYRTEKHFPPGVYVYITTTRQIGTVHEVVANADGTSIRIKGIGLVPINEVRLAQQTDIDQSGHYKGNSLVELNKKSIARHQTVLEHGDNN